MSFENKLALVTGGSSGIGFAIAHELVQQGAKVIITGRNSARLDKALQALGPNAWAFTSDTRKVAEIDKLYETIVREHGRLDIVVPNAGGAEPATLGNLTEAHVDDALATHVKGVLFTIQGALPLMAAGGSIVVVGSIASVTPAVGMSVYGGAKAAVRNMIRAWIQEIKGSGVRINVVSPGSTRTPGLENYFEAGKAEAIFASMAGQSTVGRIGVPEDIAKAVAFVASEAATYINGIELFVDGGAAQI
jgi:NAD(P)-dependent dehydrogenase (short-subunit alcohol dehydrogenase family)